MEIVEFENASKLSKGETNEKLSDGGFRKRLTNVFILYRNAINLRDGRLAYLLRIIEGLQFFHFAFLILMNILKSVKSTDMPLSRLLYYIDTILTVYPGVQNYPADVLYPIGILFNGLIWLALLMTFASFFDNFQKGICHVISFYMLDYLSHILFLPCIGFLLKTASCEKNANGNWVAVIDTNTICYGPPHDFIASLSIISSLLVILLVTFYKFIVFNQAISSTLPLSRLSNASEVSFHCVRTILMVIMIFDTVLSDDILMFVCYFFGSCYLFWVYLFESTIYDMYVERFFSVLAGTYIGMGILVGLSLLWEDDSISIIITGILAVILLAVSLSFSIYTKMTTDLAHSFNGMKKEGKVIQSIISLIRLIENTRHSDAKTANTFVSQFISYHYSMCKLPQCPISSLFNQGTTNPAVDKEIIIKKMESSVSRLTKRAILSFPHVVKLRLLYIVFLLSIKEKGDTVWRMINMMNSMNLNIIENLHLLMQKKTLQEMMDVLSAKNNTQAYMLLIQRKLEVKILREIETASELAMRFWDKLQEKSPELISFVEICSTLFKSIELIKKIWSTIKKKGVISKTVLLYYSRFCEEIEGDEERAAKLRDEMQTAKESVHTNILEAHSEKGTAVITISAKDRNVGEVIQYNAAFCQLTGYAFNELIGRKINALIPSIYSDAHDTALRNTCFALESGDSIITKDRNVYIIHVSKYIVPVTIKVLEFPHFVNNYVFVVSIVQTKEMAKFMITHLLLNPEKIITNISSNSTIHLGLNVQNIHDEALNINKVIPDFNRMKEGQRNVCGCIVRSRQENDALAKEESYEFKFNKILSSKNELLGYEVHIMKEDTWQDKDFDFDSPHRLILPPYNFEFNFNEETNKYIAGIVYSNTESALINPKNSHETPRHSRPQRESSRLIAFADNDGTLDEDDEEENHKVRTRTKMKPSDATYFYDKLAVQLEALNALPDKDKLLERCYSKPNYSEGVVLYRYKEGHFEEVHGTNVGFFKDDVDIVELEAESTDTQNNNKFIDNSKYIKSTIKNKRYLYKVISKLPLPPSYNRLFTAVVLLLIISLIIAVIEQILFEDILSGITSNLNLFSYQLRMNYYMTEASMWIMQAICVNNSILSVENAYPKATSLSQFFSQNKNGIYNTLVNFNNVVIQREKLIPSGSFNTLCGGNISYLFNDTGVNYNGILLENGYKLLIDDLFTISQYNSLANFTFNNAIVNSFLYNSNNPVIVSWNVIIINFNNEVLAGINRSTDNISVIFYASCSIVFICLFCVVIFVILIRRNISHQALIMLQVPIHNCRQQQNKANNLFNAIKDVEETERACCNLAGAEQQEEMSVRSTPSTGTQIRNEIEQIQNSTGRYTASSRAFVQQFAVNSEFVWRMLLTSVIIGGYFAGVYVIGLKQISLIKTSKSSTISNSKIPITFSGIDFGLKTLFYNPSAKFRNNPASTSTPNQVKNGSTQVAGFNSAINDILSIFPKNKKDDIIQFLYNDMCKENFPAGCNDLSARRGYLAILNEASHLEKIALYNYNGTKNVVQGINSEELRRQTELVYSLIVPAHFYIMDKIRDEIVNVNTDLVSTFITCLFVFCICLLFLAIFIWIPFVHSIKNTYNKLRILLTLIPLDVVTHNKIFHDYFSQILFKQKE